MALQGMGMYGSPPVPFPGYAAAPVPYGYMPGRPQMVPPMLGQPMGHPGMVPFYPGYVPQVTPFILPVFSLLLDALHPSCSQDF